MRIKKYAIICYILALAMLLPLSSMAVTANKKQFESPDYPSTYVDGLDNPQGQENGERMADKPCVQRTA